MNCGRRQCKRGLRGAPLYCRCGLEFCSETCFVSEWHADHQNSCPNAVEIRHNIEERRANTGRTGTTLLVGAALSRTRPTPEVLAPPPVLAPAPGAVPSAAASASTSAPRGQQEEAAPLSTPPRRQQQQLSASPAGSISTRSDSTGYPLPRELASSFASARSTGASASTSAAEAPQAKTRQVLPRYKLDEFVTVGDPLGSGSYGQVNKVIRKSTNEVFAMKLIPKRKVLEHQMTEYLHREVKTQIKMQHPNILRLHYYFEDEHNVFLLLEYAECGSLFSVMRKKRRMPEAEAARIFIGIASALDHLHKKGIVHRDLKPENILMCAGGVAKLADFGWCAELSKDGAPRNTFCGTWDYLSPEMVMNDPHNYTVDIWAMGVLLYEMLTGQPPFTAPSQVKAMARITKVDLQFPESLSPLARDLVSRLLVKEPNNRMGLASAARHPAVSRFQPEAPAAPPDSSSCATKGHVGIGTLAATAAAQAAAGAPHAAAVGVAKSADTQAQESQEARSQAFRAAIEAKLQALEVGCSLGAARPPKEAEEQPFAAAASNAGAADRNDAAAGKPGPVPSGDSAKPKLSCMPWAPPQQKSDRGAAEKVPEGGVADAAGMAMIEKPGGSSIASSSQSTDIPQASPPRSMDASAVLPEAASPAGASHTSASVDFAPPARELAGRETPEKKELWQQTETFAAIRKWVRRSGAPPTDLGEKLDKTLPAGVLENVGSRHAELAETDLLASSVAVVDGVGPRPKSRAKMRRSQTSPVSAESSPVDQAPMEQQASADSEPMSSYGGSYDQRWQRFGCVGEAGGF